MGRGLLHLTVLSASDVPRHERFGKQHCYVEIRLGSGISRSKTCKDGGQHPVWNETLFFQLQNEQQVGFRVFAERLLMKDVEVGAATVSLEQVMMNGADEAVLPLTHKGQQQGTLSISLELRSFNTTLHSRGSSGSPHSSASLAYSPSGSLGGSFTGPSGLKQSSLPILLMQQPNLALYREQLLQQSALLAAQQQQQQQLQRSAGLSRMSGGAGSSGGGGGGRSGGDGLQQQQRSLRWVPKKTPADLFPSPSPSMQQPSDTPDLLGMFGAVESSTFSDFSSANSQHGYAATQQAFDAQRVQALVDAVYGPGAGNVAAFSEGSSSGVGTGGKGQTGRGQSSQAPATAAAAAAAAAASMRNKGVTGQAGKGTAVGVSRRSSAGESVSVASVELSGGSGSSRHSSRSGAAAGSSRAAAAAAAGGADTAGVFDPFGAATCHAAAAAAGGTPQPPSLLRPAAAPQGSAGSPMLRPGLPSSSRPPQAGARRRSSGSSSSASSGSSSSKAAATVLQPPAHRDAAPAGLQGGGMGAPDMPDGFGLAAMQAAAAAFAAASGGALLLGSSAESSLQEVEEEPLGDGDPNAFLAGVMVPTASQPSSAAVQAAAGQGQASPTGTQRSAAAAAAAGGGSMPDPFGTHGVMQAAVAAAAAALHGFDMPDPFGTGHRHAAEAAGTGSFRGEMPDPFAGPSAAAAAAAAAAGFGHPDAAAGSSGSSAPGAPEVVQEPAEPSIRLGDLGQSTSGRPPSGRSSRAGAVMLQTVMEVSESPSTSSVALHSIGSDGSPLPSGACGAAAVTAGPHNGRPSPTAQLGHAKGAAGGAAGQQQQQVPEAAAASTRPAQQLSIGVQQLSSGAVSDDVTTAGSCVEVPRAPVLSAEGSQPLQEQVSQLVKQLQERDVMVHQLQEQLRQVQQQLQSMRSDTGSEDLRHSTPKP